MFKNKKSRSLILMQPVYDRILELQQSMRAENLSEFEIEKATQRIVDEAFKQIKNNSTSMLPQLEFASK